MAFQKSMAGLVDLVDPPARGFAGRKKPVPLHCRRSRTSPVCLDNAFVERAEALWLRNSANPTPRSMWTRCGCAWPSYPNDIKICSSSSIGIRSPGLRSRRRLA